VGDKVGVAWLRQTCGTCRYCRRGAENLCPHSLYTGWDADGGYAEYCTVPAAFAYQPHGYGDVELAPLLCAGIIGYRALQRTSLPHGGRLGIYGFGGSAHLTAQVALAQGATVHVMTRGARAQRLALDLGAASAVGAYDAPPEPLDGAILFAPDTRIDGRVVRSVADGVHGGHVSSAGDFEAIRQFPKAAHGVEVLPATGPVQRRRALYPGEPSMVDESASVST
jgi:zinc-binding alcohol dehydrogenase family protein